MAAGNPTDPMEFLRNLWGGNGFSLPGMVTPTIDVDELDKQIRDLKTVEGWLRTNLSMLSMTIQNLEMQRATLNAVKNMSQMYADATQSGSAPGSDAAPGDAGAFAQSAMWPWTMMQQMHESMQNAAAEAGEAAKAAANAVGSDKKAAPRARPRKPE
jgi:hypothetical protein